MAGEGRAGRQSRLHGRGDENGGREQLEKQQPAGTKPLPGDVRLPVADLIRPQVQCGDDARRPANFQEIEGDDGR